MEYELKPCPFCTSDKIRIGTIHDGYKHIVTCTSCNAISGEYNTQEDAIRAWNRRADKVNSIELKRIQL